MNLKLKPLIMKESKTLRVWEILNEGKDIPITELSRKSKVSRAMIYEVIRNLKRRNLINISRKIGKSYFYSITHSGGSKK